MFCSQCGSELENDANFCSSCGASTSSAPAPVPEQDPVDTSTPIITARPVFIPWVTVASVLPKTLFMTIWAGLFLGGVSSAASEALKWNLSFGMMAVFFGTLTLVGIPLVTYLAKKNTYADTVYRFYVNRLEYAEGFWTVERKVIKYNNIVEASLSRGMVQKMHGLGTIVLFTPATVLNEKQSKSGICLRDIENSEEIYQKVLELID